MLKQKEAMLEAVCKSSFHKRNPIKSNGCKIKRANTVPTSGAPTARARACVCVYGGSPVTNG